VLALNPHGRRLRRRRVEDRGVVVESEPHDDHLTTITSTSSAATGQRGLKGIVTILAGNGSDDGKGVPGPATEAASARR